MDANIENGAGTPLHRLMSAQTASTTQQRRLRTLRKPSHPLTQLAVEHECIHLHKACAVGNKRPAQVQENGGFLP